MARLSGQKLPGRRADTGVYAVKNVEIRTHFHAMDTTYWDERIPGETVATKKKA